MSPIAIAVANLEARNEELENEVKALKQKLQHRHTTIFDLNASKRILEKELAKVQSRRLSNVASVFYRKLGKTLASVTPIHFRKFGIRH